MCRTAAGSNETLASDDQEPDAANETHQQLHADVMCVQPLWQRRSERDVMHVDGAEHRLGTLSRFLLHERLPQGPLRLLTPHQLAVGVNLEHRMVSMWDCVLRTSRWPACSVMVRSTGVKELRMHHVARQEQCSRMRRQPVCDICFLQGVRFFEWLLRRPACAHERQMFHQYEPKLS